MGFDFGIIGDVGVFDYVVWVNGYVVIQCDFVFEYYVDVDQDVVVDGQFILNIDLGWIGQGSIFGYQFVGLLVLILVFEFC